MATLTYRRPQHVATLLPHLVEQVESVAGLVGARVLVVDNDPDASAAEAVAPWAERASVRYAHEPEPGISAARNRALAESDDSRFLAFIDDDEIPRENWLRQLLLVQRQYGAAAVLGPVLPEYERQPDPWLLAGGFFDRPRRPTGTRLPHGFCGNTLLDLDQVRAMGLRFDLDFSLSGGEDTLFTMQLHRGGGAIVWSDDACVTDLVPATRMNRRWVLTRRFSAGNSYALSAMVLQRAVVPRLLLRARFLAGGTVRMLAGGGQYLVGSATRSRRQQARGLRTAARGLGLTAGAVGYRYLEYRRDAPHEGNGP